MRLCSVLFPEVSRLLFRFRPGHEECPVRLLHKQRVTWLEWVRVRWHVSAVVTSPLHPEELWVTHRGQGGSPQGGQHFSNSIQSSQKTVLCVCVCEYFWSVSFFNLYFDSETWHCYFTQFIALALYFMFSIFEVT